MQVGFTKEGNLLALDMKLYSNAGNSTDLSLPVNLAVCLVSYLVSCNLIRLWKDLSCTVRMLITFQTSLLSVMFARQTFHQTQPSALLVDHSQCT